MKDPSPGSDEGRLVTITSPHSQYLGETAEILKSTPHQYKVKFADGSWARLSKHAVEFCEEDEEEELRRSYLRDSGEWSVRAKTRPDGTRDDRRGGGGGGGGGNQPAVITKVPNDSFTQNVDEKHASDRRGYPTILATHPALGLFFLGKDHIVQVFDADSEDDEKEVLGAYVHPVRVLWAECSGEMLVTLDERGVGRIWSIKYPDQPQFTLPETVNLGVPLICGILADGCAVCVSTHFPPAARKWHFPNDSKTGKESWNWEDEANAYTNKQAPSHICITDINSGVCLARLAVASDLHNLRVGVCSGIVFQVGSKDATGNVISDRTPLQVGEKVEVNREGKGEWVEAVIVSVLEEGKYAVRHSFTSDVESTSCGRWLRGRGTNLFDHIEDEGVHTVDQAMLRSKDTKGLTFLLYPQLLQDANDIALKHMMARMVQLLEEKDLVIAKEQALGDDDEDDDEVSEGSLTIDAKSITDFKHAEWSCDQSLTSTQLVRTDPPRAEFGIANAAAVKGKVAVIVRGGCSFVEKVKRAVVVGAVGVVIIDNNTGRPDEVVEIVRSEGDGAPREGFAIPVLSVSHNVGQFIKRAGSRCSVEFGAKHSQSWTVRTHAEAKFVEGQFVLGIGEGVSQVRGWVTEVAVVDGRNARAREIKISLPRVTLREEKRRREVHMLAATLMTLEAEIERNFGASRLERHFTVHNGVIQSDDLMGQLLLRVQTPYIAVIHCRYSLYTAVETFKLESFVKGFGGRMTGSAAGALLTHKWSSPVLHPRSCRGAFITTIPGDANSHVTINDAGEKVDKSKPRAVLLTHDDGGPMSKNHPAKDSACGQRGVAVMDLQTGEPIWHDVDGSRVDAAPHSIWKDKWSTTTARGVVGEMAVSDAGLVFVAPTSGWAGMNKTTSEFTAYDLTNPQSGVEGGDKQECKWLVAYSKAPEFVIEPRDHQASGLKKVANDRFNGKDEDTGFSLPLLDGLVRSLEVVKNTLLVLGMEQHQQHGAQSAQLRVVAYDIKSGDVRWSFPVTPVATRCQVVSLSSATRPTLPSRALQRQVKKLPVFVYTGDSTGAIRQSVLQGADDDFAEQGTTRVLCRRTDVAQGQQPSPWCAEITAISISVKGDRIVSGASDGTLEAHSCVADVTYQFGERIWRSTPSPEGYELLQRCLQSSRSPRPTNQKGACLTRVHSEKYPFKEFCAHPWGVTHVEIVDEFDIVCSAGNDGRVRACKLSDGTEEANWVASAKRYAEQNNDVLVTHPYHAETWKWTKSRVQYMAIVRSSDISISVPVLTAVGIPVVVSASKDNGIIGQSLQTGEILWRAPRQHCFNPRNFCPLGAYGLGYGGGGGEHGGDGRWLILGNHCAGDPLRIIDCGPSADAAGREGSGGDTSGQVEVRQPREIAERKPHNAPASWTQQCRALNTCTVTSVYVVADSSNAAHSLIRSLDGACHGIVLHGFGDGVITLTLLPPPATSRNHVRVRVTAQPRCKIYWQNLHAHTADVTCLSHVEHSAGALVLSGGKDASFCVTRFADGAPVRRVRHNTGISSLIPASVAGWASSSNAAGGSVMRRELLSNGTKKRPLQQEEDLAVIVTPAEVDSDTIALVYSSFYLQLGMIVQNALTLGEVTVGGGEKSLCAKVQGALEHLPGMASYQQWTGWKEEYAAVLGFAYTFVMILWKFMQIAGFAFKAITPPAAVQKFQAVLQWAQAPMGEVQKLQDDVQGKMHDILGHSYEGDGGESGGDINDGGGDAQSKNFQFHKTPEMSVYASLGLVFVFLLVLQLQEWIEWNAFRYPKRGLRVFCKLVTWTNLWSAVSVFADLVAGALFLPIFSILVQCFHCKDGMMVFDDDLGSGDGDKGVAEKASGTVCWSPPHLRMVVSSVVAILLYVPACLRFLLAGSELRNLEIIPWRPFDWKRDKVEEEAKEIRQRCLYPETEHPFAAGSAYFDALEICLKLCLVATALLGADTASTTTNTSDTDDAAPAATPPLRQLARINATSNGAQGEEQLVWFGFLSHDTLVSALNLVQAVVLVILTVKFPPHINAGAERTRLLLNSAAAWLMLCALISTIFGDNSDLSQFLPLGLVLILAMLLRVACSIGYRPFLFMLILPFRIARIALEFVLCDIIRGWFRCVCCCTARGRKGPRKDATATASVDANGNVEMVTRGSHATVL